MSIPTIVLKWEWPADRVATKKILVRVDDLRSPSRGFLGIGASPSLANHLPDAKVLKATVLAGDMYNANTQVELTLPGRDAAGLSRGSLAGLGLLGEEAVCICAAVSPETGQSATREWFERWTCNQSAD